MLPKKLDTGTFIELITKKIEDGFKAKGFQLIGTGSFRNTFKIDEKTVIKVPNDNDSTCGGIICNLNENYIHNKYKKLKVFAPCKVMWKYGIPLLYMECLENIFYNRRETKSFYKTLKNNKIELFDGEAQIGVNLDGIVKCYDYGNEYSIIPTPIQTRIDRQAHKIVNEAVQKYGRLVI